MDTTRRSAAIVGVLFIVATGFFSIGQIAHGPVFGSSEYLELAESQSVRLIAGILIELVAVLAIPLTAIFLFPVLKRHSEALALAYVGIRLLEAGPLLLVDANLLALVKASSAYLMADAGEIVRWHTMGGSIQLIRESFFSVSVGLVFPVGALLLNWMLFQTRLVPRFISGWGFLAAALLLAGSVLVFFDVFAALPAAPLEAALAGPIALQEMVFAVWLLAKGFDGAGLAALRMADDDPVE